jgi:hypothetical protein
MHKEVFGVPAWMWGVGAVVVVGGYLYLSHKSASSSAGGQQKPAGGGQPVMVAGSPTGLSMEQFLLLIEDMQHGGKGKGKSTGHHGGGGTKPNPGGPERRWLIHKTGSQHPWTFLAQHHERIVVGPHGTRTIVHDKKGGHR